MASSDRAFEYKGIQLDLTKLMFDVAHDNLADLLELFRIEGMLTPIIMKQPLLTFHDFSYDKLHNAWEYLSQSLVEKKLPALEQLPICNLHALGYIKVSYQDMKNNNFYYIDFKQYAQKGDICYITSSKKTIIDSKSPNAILYHVVNAVSLLKADITYTLHYTKVPDIAFQGWYGMHIPFSDERNIAFQKGVVSLIRKI